MDANSKKLRELEKNVISDIPKTKTVLYIDDEVEHEIHKRAGDILSRQRDIATELYDTLKANPKAEINIHALDLDADDQAIVDKSNILYHFRVMELFDKGIGQFVHFNDPICKYVFYSRFTWFLSEMKEWCYWLWWEDQTYDEPGFFDLCAGEQEKRLKPLHEHWRKYLTEDSWKKHCEEHPPKLQDTLPEMTEEQEEEERKQIEKENAEEEAKDAKILAEKCPSCTEKCKWYFEQVGPKMSENVGKIEVVKNE